MASQIEDFEWDVLLEKLKSPKCECALVLGEDAFFTSDGQPLKDNYNAFLDKDLAGLFKRQKESDLLSMADHDRTTFCTKVRNFYADLEPGNLLQQIAQIPFPIIINTTPHGQIAKAITWGTPQLKHYNRSAQQEKIDKPTTSTPLIYNLVGTIEDDNTLVLTYNNLFDYFDSIFHEYRLPDDLREILRGIKYFVFLGVPFDRWYFHLFLRILNIHTFKNAHRHTPIDTRFDKSVMEFCNELFEIKFVTGRKNLAEFVTQLHARCAQAHILRLEMERVLSVLDSIEIQLKSDELEQAIISMGDYLKELRNDDLTYDLAIFSARFNKYRKGTLNDTLDPREAKTEYAQIVNGLNILLNSVRKLPTT